MSKKDTVKKVVIELNNAGIAFVTKILDGGQEIIRTMPSQSLLENIAKGIDVPRAFTMWVPPSVRFIQRTEDKTLVAMEVQPTKVKIKTRNRKVPRTCWLVLVENNHRRLLDSYVYALKSSLIDDNTELFNLKLSNVYDENGRICWGGAKTLYTGTDPIKHAVSTVARFYSSGFNGDLYGGIPKIGKKMIGTFGEIVLKKLGR